MSTEIKTIKGTYHSHFTTDKVERKEAEIAISRFYNGRELGSNIQLTIIQANSTYIHLTKEQCKELVEVLLNCFDYNKYPSD